MGEPEDIFLLGGVENVVDLEGVVACYIVAAIWGVELAEKLILTNDRNFFLLCEPHSYF